MDAEVQQRELAQAEAERRAAILGEQRAVWGSLQAVVRHVQSSEMQQALVRLEQMESAGRQAISEAAVQAAGLGSVVLQGLQGLLVTSHEAVVVAAAQAEQETAVRLECEELERRLAIVQAEREGLVQQQGEAVRQAVCHEVEQQEAVARLELVAEQSAGEMAIALFQWDAVMPVRDHFTGMGVDRPTSGMEGKLSPRHRCGGFWLVWFAFGRSLPPKLGCMECLPDMPVPLRTEQCPQGFHFFECIDWKKCHFGAMGCTRGLWVLFLFSTNDSIQV